MEYVVYTYTNEGKTRLLKSFKSFTSAKKYSERLSEEIVFPVFLRERESYDHDEDFHPYKFRRGQK